jgi:mono/diheme cytochrome c family protein
MIRSTGIVTLLLIGCSSSLAQSPSSNEGQRIVLQHCGVCHLKIQINVQQSFGPPLSKAIFANGRDEEIKGIIANGTPNMPGFKHLLRPDQIEAVVAYLKNADAIQSSTR